MNAFTFGATLVLAVLLPTLARAADEGATSLLMEGVDRYRHEDYEGARILFERAYELASSTRTLFNLALAEFQSGHVVESVRRLRVYLMAPDAEPEKIEVIKTKWLPRAEAQTSRLQVDAPAGAEIVVDGHSEGQAPLQTLDVGVGDHDVLARDETWSHAEHVVTRPGELFLIRFDKPPSARAQRVGPEVSVPTPNGRAPNRPPAAKLATEIALVSGAAVSTGLGVAFAVAGNNDSDAARSLASQLPADPHYSQCRASPQPLQCPRLEAANRALSEHYYLSNGFYAAAGVLAGAAIVTWFVWPSRASSPAAASTSVSVVAVVGADRVGLAVGGAW